MNPHTAIAPQEIQAAAQAIFEDVFACYRQLHMHPEAGDAEHRTQAHIQAELTALGIPHRTIARTGVLGWIQGTKEPTSSPERVVALRADIDALPIHEATGLPYASTVPGMMHACGHDAHTAILLGVAKVLMAHRHRFFGTVKLLFQPAEETIGGAERMVQEGCMDNPRVDRVYGLHVFPRLETGTVELTPGKMNASTDEIHIRIHGKSGHGAYPHDAIDALSAGAHVVVALQSLISRRLNPIESAVLTLGTMRAGVKGNVIADTAEMKGSLRTLDEGVRRQMKAWIETTVSHTAAAHGAEGTVHFEPGYNALINDETIVREAEGLFKSILGAERVTIARTPSLGAEDFSFFLDRAPGMFYNLGCGDVARGFVHKGHHPQFAVAPEALTHGVALQCLLTLNYLGALAGPHDV